jgi:hypothetical protein
MAGNFDSPVLAHVACVLLSCFPYIAHSIMATSDYETEHSQGILDLFDVPKCPKWLLIPI